MKLQFITIFYPGQNDLYKGYLKILVKPVHVEGWRAQRILSVNHAIAWAIFSTFAQPCRGIGHFIPSSFSTLRPLALKFQCFVRGRGPLHYQPCISDNHVQLSRPPCLSDVSHFYSVKPHLFDFHWFLSHLSNTVVVSLHSIGHCPHFLHHKLARRGFLNNKIPRPIRSNYSLYSSFLLNWVLGEPVNQFDIHCRRNMSPIRYPYFTNNSHTFVSGTLLTCFAATSSTITKIIFYGAHLWNLLQSWRNAVH